jgi:hypothetical protein
VLPGTPCPTYLDGTALLKLTICLFRFVFNNQPRPLRPYFWGGMRAMYVMAPGRCALCHVLLVHCLCGLIKPLHTCGVAAESAPGCSACLPVSLVLDKLLYTPLWSCDFLVKSCSADVTSVAADPSQACCCHCSSVVAWSRAHLEGANNAYRQHPARHITITQPDGVPPPQLIISLVSHAPTTYIYIRGRRM